MSTSLIPAKAAEFCEIYIASWFDGCYLKQKIEAYSISWGQRLFFRQAGLKLMAQAILKPLSFSNTEITNMLHHGPGYP